MKRFCFLFIIVLLVACKSNDNYRVTNALRAPACPLVTIDTYTNTWLFGDTLYKHQLTHWTGQEFPLLGVIQVDGQSYRFMGVESEFLLIPLLKTSAGEAWTSKYTTEAPADKWMLPEYNDESWKDGVGAYGYTQGERLVNTAWESEHLWVRREFELERDISNETIILDLSYDDEITLYVNGIEVITVEGHNHKFNDFIELPAHVVKNFKKGKNVIAAYVRNRGGYAFLDFGINAKTSAQSCFAQTAVQNSVEVLPTQTRFTFTCGPVDLELTFTSPLLMDNLDLLSRPVNYISYQIQSNDSKHHDVNLYLESSTTWALNEYGQASNTESFEKNKLLFLKTGSQQQQILAKRGDDIRIDWGYFYFVAEARKTQSATGDSYTMRKEFAESGMLSGKMSCSPDEQNRLAFSRNLGRVKNTTDGFFMIGYDDVYSIRYFGENLLPYWNRNDDVTIEEVFLQSKKDYKTIKAACDKFDYALMTKARRSGGKEYAELCALVYRQTVSAHKLVQNTAGEMLLLSKENCSGGNIATVDVTYPSSPLFLLYNVDLLKAMLNPIFYYVESDRWDKPYAPHDIGIYPIAEGQMSQIFLPVEESGNMLIMMAAIAAVEGNAQYAAKHWDTLSGWADFLVEKGFDPDYQENTDIFTGFSSHNANLSIKAIQGIASYGRLADMLGYNDTARKYTKLARTMALEWVEKTDDGDHFRLAFDQPGTWSQKYNLVWDKILKINVFPHEVPEREIAFYLSKQNKYGLPLDSKNTYTKADWIVWSATLSSTTEDFQQLIRPLYCFVNETTDRVPMSDWYWTDRPEHVGFRARSVLGGFFIKILEDKLIFIEK
ncbi:MAG TPA: DUF4965 domain-containing protein [Paludibacter sp.]|nr:MAG: hypothetical protein BWY08_01049 [Bacteroidetes bacterium ADurb.Bin174]HQB27636.1 DUF4965 domain-containing protein [Paludibacter sp.]